MTTAEKIEAMADYIETYGHWQGGGAFPPDFPGDISLADCKPPACVLGAFFKVDGSVCWQKSSVAKAINPVAWKSENCIGTPHWSDTTPTPVVLRTLREVAAKLQAQEMPVLTNRDPGDEDPNWEVRSFEPVTA